MDLLSSYSQTSEQKGMQMDKLILSGNGNGNDDEKNLMSILNQTALNISSISDQMGVVVGQVKSMKATQVDHGNRITDLENWKQHKEDHERVDRNQARRIRSAIHSRVDFLLGMEFSGGLVTKECMDVDKKYRGAFFSRCYVDARKYSDLGNPYYETYTKDYDAVINYIENWVPEVEYAGKTGTKAYISYLDDRRKA